MTRFDAVEAQPATSTFDSQQVARALFDGGYQNNLQGPDAKFVKIADNGPGLQAPDAMTAGAQDSPQPQDVIKAISAADPKDLPDSLKPLQGLASHFDKADDKAGTLAQIKDSVEKAIAAADTSSAAEKAKIKTDGAALEPEIAKVKAAMDAAKPALEKAAAQVKPEDQQRIGTELTLLVDDKTSPALKKAIEADLADKPGLVDAFKAFTDARKSAVPVALKAQELEARAEEAKEGPIVSRLIYADMLEQAGDKAGAKKEQAEAMALQMGMSIDDFKKLQQRQAPSDK